MNRSAKVAESAGLRAARQRFPERVFRCDGLDWTIRDSGGDGPALLLLPGGLGTADIFYPQMLGLAASIRCICVSYPATGHEAMASGLDRLLDWLGLGRASLLGSSLAGYRLQHFALGYPERVEAVLLANSFCDGTGLRSHPLFDVAALEAVTGDALKAEWLARLEARSPDELRDAQIVLLRDGQTGDDLRQKLLAAATAPAAPTIPEGLFPISVLDCADDSIVDEAMRDALAERYPQAPRVTLREGGHYPCVTQADAYDRFITEAVAAVSGARRG